MSGNGDFFVGYAAGQGAGANNVDVQGHYNNGFVDGISTGAEHEHINQSWYVQRLMRHLRARNSQKQALLQALKKFAPNHPYLNETIVPNAASELLENMKKDETFYPRVANNGNIDEMSNLLVAEMGGGIVTEGDLAMEADGVAFLSVDDRLPEEEEAALMKTFNDLDAEPAIRAERVAELNVFEAAQRAADARAVGDEKFSSIMKPATNFMNKIFG